MTKRTASSMWAVWVAAGCALEAVTFARGESGSTLSGQIWDRTHIRRRMPFHEKTRRAVTIGFIVWLPIHWVSGGKV